MRNDNQLIWEAFQSKITEARSTEARRTPEEAERLKRNLERYQYLMSAQEQGYGGDYYFDRDEFEDYGKYEAEIEDLEKEAEANGYLEDLKKYANFDARDERRSRLISNDPLKHDTPRITRAGKAHAGDVKQRKKALRRSVRGTEKPDLP